MCLIFAEIDSKITDIVGTYAYIKEIFDKYYGVGIPLLFLVATISVVFSVAITTFDILGSIFLFFVGGMSSNIAKSFIIPGDLLVLLAPINLTLFFLSNLSKNELVGIITFVVFLFLIFLIMNKVKSN
ncbi:hypothetical protein A9200_11415 [Maribacter hydrothermalis]|uniref:Uncharacterized protein n=1 Tax=Maribacter hydrothermalis TaxID=1836467 RepID=A0A1B7YXG2_9FLAO|nr:hypothetical protein BTR34_05185 [Maribacter hydrothermalis]OBR35175.1 hypothetical protein A9200_11415 [Maribacter hydrothermalis]